jgi:hypothetical protein
MRSDEEVLQFGSRHRVTGLRPLKGSPGIAKRSLQSSLDLLSGIPENVVVNENRAFRAHGLVLLFKSTATSFKPLTTRFMGVV